MNQKKILKVLIKKDDKSTSAILRGSLVDNKGQKSNLLWRNHQNKYFKNSFRQIYDKKTFNNFKSFKKMKVRYSYLKQQFANSGDLWTKLKNLFQPVILL